MGWLGLHTLRERRTTVQAQRRRRHRRKPKSYRYLPALPVMIFFLTLTFFMTVKLHVKLHPRALRSLHAHRNLPHIHSSTSQRRTGTSRRRLSHRPSKNWHAAAVARVAPGAAWRSTRRTYPLDRRRHLARAKQRTGPVATPRSATHKEPQRKIFQPHAAARRALVHYHTVSLGFAPGGRPAVLATKATWDALPSRVKLQPLRNATLPWEHVANDARPTAPPLDRTTSIFAALRKGPWMGCSRANAMLCTGVYRSLKRSAAASLFDVNCARHLEWLPKVLDKLMNEYRLVRVVCGVSTNTDLATAKAALGGRRFVRFVRFSALTAHTEDFPYADVTLAREALRGNLITVMRFLKMLKRAARSNFLIHENFPNERLNEPTQHGLWLNAALPPFSLPPPFYTHADPEDVFGMQIACRAISEMFEMRSTPTMNDLVDPRRRRVLE